MTKIIDSHHHLWKYNADEFGWMDESMEILRRDYLAEDIEKLIENADVDGTVVVQARQSLEETEWLLDLAENNDFIKGVVGWVDLRSEDLEEQLEMYVAEPKFVGVRHVLQDEPDIDYMLKPKFLRGIELLADFDLSYDLLIRTKHLQNTLELVNMFPGQRFVIDHMAKPLIKSGIRAPWKEDMYSLGELPNIWCKVSGMITEANLMTWQYSDLLPYLDIVYKAFGPDRIMLGSDWPVCNLAGDYKKVMEIPKKYFTSFDEDDIEKIFRLNCIEFYKLEL